MFRQRFIAVCLLAIYGLPASIGPHWHHHGASCNHAICDGADCSGEEASSKRTSLPGRLLPAEGHSACGCNSHGEVSEPQPRQKSDPAASTSQPPTAGNDATSKSPHASKAVRAVQGADSGHCAICDFYSQSQTCGDFCQATAGCLLNCELYVAEPSALFGHVPTSRARGPPCRRV